MTLRSLDSPPPLINSVNFIELLMFRFVNVKLFVVNLICIVGKPKVLTVFFACALSCFVDDRVGNGFGLSGCDFFLNFVFMDMQI